jgi:hypothetical protein
MSLLPSSRLMAVRFATLWGLLALAGCGGDIEPPTSPPARAQAAQPVATESHGPALVTDMLRLSFVGCVDQSGGELPARHTLIHIRNVRCPTLWEFEAAREGQLSEDELSREYETLKRRLGAIQAEQAEFICWCRQRAGTKHVWFEEVTDESLPRFRKLAVDTVALQNDPGLRLRLGAVGRLLSAGLADVRPLPDVMARDESEGSVPDREGQEDALVRRIVEQGEGLSVVVLDGERDLRDNLERLGKRDWELLTVDVQAYVRFAPDRTFAE